MAGQHQAIIIYQISENYENLLGLLKLIYISLISHFMTRLRLLDNHGSVDQLQRKILVVKILNKIKSSFFADPDFFLAFFPPISRRDSDHQIAIRLWISYD
jgi:hypothetical protein